MPCESSPFPNDLRGHAVALRQAMTINEYRLTMKLRNPWRFRLLSFLGWL